MRRSRTSSGNGEDQLKDQRDECEANKSAHDDLDATDTASLIGVGFRLLGLGEAITTRNCWGIEAAESAAWIFWINPLGCTHRSVDPFSALERRAPVVMAPSDALLTRAAYFAQTPPA